MVAEIGEVPAEAEVVPHPLLRHLQLLQTLRLSTKGRVMLQPRGKVINYAKSISDGEKMELTVLPLGNVQ